MVCCLLSFMKLDFGGDWNLKRVAVIVGSKWGVSAMFLIVYMYTNEVRLLKLINFNLKFINHHFVVCL